jgi:CheY-like chemotaxis protein
MVPESRAKTFYIFSRYRREIRGLSPSRNQTRKEFYVQQDRPPSNPPTRPQNEQASSKNGRTASTVRHEWQEDQKLGRFFSKLLGEVCFLGADKAEFKMSGDSVLGAIVKDGKAIKSLTVKPVWIPLIKRWLIRRENPVGIPTSKYDFGTPCAVKIGDSIVSFFFQHSKNLSGAETLSLSRCVAQSVDTYAEQVLGRAPSRVQLDRMSSHERGTIFVCTTPGVEYFRKVAPVLGVTGAGYLGDFSERGVREILEEVSGQALSIVSISANDITEALVTLRESGVSLESIGFRGCVNTAHLHKVCKGCAKKVSVDPTIMAQVPEYLSALSLERYQVGRGCDDCGHKGYKGELMVFSVASASPLLSKWYRSEGSQSDLVRALIPHGVRPLFEEGYRRALEGETTLEAVVAVTKSVPVVYLEYWKNGGKPRAEKPQEGGVVSHISESSDLQFKTGVREAHEGMDSAPLFAKLANTPRRERPMVLVVEDDDDQRSILELVLRGANYDVVQAANGAEALEAVQSGSPDIIISDLMMPIMDGSQMVAHLKMTPATSQVPILMLTMVADEEREYALLNLGADDYCEKTIQRKVLLKRVENLLKRTQSTHQQ